MSIDLEAIRCRLKKIHDFKVDEIPRPINDSHLFQLLGYADASLKDIPALITEVERIAKLLARYTAVNAELHLEVDMLRADLSDEEVNRTRAYKAVEAAEAEAERWCEDRNVAWAEAEAAKKALAAAVEDNACLKSSLKDVQEKYRWMLERAADQKLDGYRELGARAAKAENERDALHAQVVELKVALGRTAYDLDDWLGGWVCRVCCEPKDKPHSPTCYVGKALTPKETSNVLD